MADCIVILECCTGQTGCNKKITIGYLKSFIMSGSTHLIKTTAGTDVNVNSSKPDAYEPTYAELTSGSILPIYSDGGNNRGASSVDGITIGGSYTADETVDQTDLTLTYTRFKSLSISAGKTAFDKCGDSTTMSYTYTLAKTVKGISVCNPLTYSYTSTDVRDTSNTAPNKVTFSAGCNWINVSGTGISAGQNGTGHSSTRTCNISASVMYKGNTQTAGNTVSISQPGVGGNWIYSSTTYDSLSIDTYDDTEYDCDGGSFSIDGTGYYTDYYYWRDDCGNNYYNETTTSSDSEYAGEDSGSFPNCPDAHNQSTTLSITWHGITKSMTFRQICTCEDCTNYNDYGECSATATAEKCGGLIEVSCSMPITTHTRTWVDGVCVDTTGTTTQRQSATVFVPENATQSEKTHPGSVTTEEGGTINYTITQEAGPCGGCTGEVTTYQYSNVTTSITACQTDVPVSIPYTATTTYDNCSTTVSYGTATTSYTVSKNETSSSTSYTKTFVGIGAAEATITINQGAGPCTCLCSMLTVSPTSYTWTYDKTSTDTNDITISSAACTSSITVNTLTHFNATVGTGKVTVSPKGTNTSGSNYEETLTISYKADATNCSSSVTLTQTAQADPCAGKTCSELTVTGVTTAFNTSYHNNVTIGNFDKGSCATITNVTSSNNWLSNVSADTSTNTIKGTMGAQGCETSSRTSTVTLYWTVNGNNCHSDWTVTQNGDSTPCSNPCSCSKFSASTTSLSFYSNGTLKSTPTWKKTEDCDGTFSLSGDSNVISASLNSDGNISVSVNSNSSTASTYSGSLKVMLGSTSCSTLTYTVDARSCECSDLSTPEAVTTSVGSGGSTNFVVWKVNKDSCADKIEATSGTCDSIFTSVGTGTSGSYYVISATASSNSSENAKTCTIGYKYYKTGDSTPCKSGSTGVTVAGTGACDCTAANADIGSYSETIPATGGSGYISYTADCGTVSASTDFSRVTITSIDTTNKRIYFSMSANDTSNERYDYINLWIEGLTTYCTYTKINQYGKPSCDCNSFSATTDSTTFPQTGGTITVWKITHSCGSVVATSASCDSLITSVSTSSVSDGTEIKATANANSGENDVTCKVGYYFKPNASSSCTDSGETTVTVPGTGVCDCDASNISIQGLSTNLPYSGGTELQIGTYTANCTTNLTFFADGLTNVNYSNGKIYANVPANTSFTSEESYQIKCKFGSTECNKTDGVSQEKKPCNCTTANFQIDPTTMDRVYDDDNFYVNYSADCGSVSATVVSGNDWITGITVNNDDVTFDITENTSTTSARTGSVKLYLVGNESCSASTTITQGKAPCNCTTSNFNVDTTTKYISSGASTLAATIKYSADCGTVSATVTTGSDWITGLSVHQTSAFHDVDLKVTANTGAERSGTVNVYLVDYENSCTSAVTVVQSAGTAPCACGAFAITSAPYSASCISKTSHSNETIATYSGLCGSITSITVSDSNGLFNGTPTTSSTNSIIANINANCGVERTATVTVNYNNGGTCTAKTFDVKQCAGGISSISANPTSLDCSGGTVTFTANTR